MRAAPAVQVRCRGRGDWAALQVGVVALAALSFVYWALCWVGGSSLMAASAALAFAAAVAVLGWRVIPDGSRRLAWDGSVWRLQTAADPAVPGHCVTLLDLGGWMLVRFEATQPQSRWPSRTWLALSRADVAADWHGLRVALFSGSAKAAADGRAAGRPVAE